MSHIRYLAESKEYKLYSLFESVYLKDKATCNSLTEFEEADRFLAWVYGDPDSALITFDNLYVVIAGCGITIYNIDTKEVVALFQDPEKIEWTEGIYQSADDSEIYVRFNALSETDKPAIKRLNILTYELETLSN